MPEPEYYLDDTFPTARYVGSGTVAEESEEELPGAKPVDEEADGPEAKHVAGPPRTKARQEPQETK